MTAELLTHDIPGGAAWSVPVRAGRRRHVHRAGAGANLSMLLFGADPVDRLNIPDTLKAQMRACIRPPMVLMSDRGLALASVTGRRGLARRAAAGTTRTWTGSLVRLPADRNAWRCGATGLLSELPSTASARRTCTPA